MKKKKNKLKEVEDFLEEHGISGIIRIPDYGTFSMFLESGDKLSILEHAKIELDVLDELRKNEVKFRIAEENRLASKKSKEFPRYIQ